MRVLTRGWSSLLVVGGSTVLSWLLGTPASFTRNPPSSMAGGGTSADVPAPQPPVRLHDWTAHPPPPASSGRNVFGFQRTAPKVTARDQEALDAPPQVPDAPIVAPFRLIGMAQETDDAASPVTAILSGQGQIYLVKAGDVVSSYTVTNISPGSVELTDAAQGRTFRLVMN
jgi:hypothetical protein